MITRRSLLAGGAGLFLSSRLVIPVMASDEAVSYKLKVMKAKALLLEDEEGAGATDIWGYNGTVPGPVLKVKRGQALKVEVENALEQATTVHWHGIRIDNKMDGVAGLTQEPIPPGGKFTYDFTLPDAGTFWYHPHNRSWEQLARGLYGALIVEEDVPLPIDRDYLVIADDWRLTNKGALHEVSFGHMMDKAHAGRLGNVLTLNGRGIERLKVKSGERVRLRFVNTANARVMNFTLPGNDMWLIALDGQPVKVTKLDKRGVTLAPAQRADVVVDVAAKPGEEIPIVMQSGRNKLNAGYLVCEKEGIKTRWKGVSMPALSANDVPLPKPGEGRLIDLVMTGGAMRFLQSASYKGKQLDGRTLARKHGQVWAFNGVAGMTDKPLFSAKKGETIRIKIVNDTAWQHGIHLHGHHFLITSRTTPQEPAGALRDTVLLEPDETVEIALVCDNPGKWMLHCHMLEHQAGGMGTWFEVKA